MKSTIFSQILAASLLPVVFIFILLFYIISNNIYSVSSDYAAASITLSAEQTLFQFESKLKVMDKLVKLTSENLQYMDKTGANSETAAEHMLIEILEADENIYCSWFVFEPGVFSKDSRYIKSYIRGENNTIEAHRITEEELDDTENTAWYNLPTSTGQPLFNAIYMYDFSNGRGPMYTGTISYPIITDGKVIGCIGVDMLYDDFFELLDEKLSFDGTISLLVSDKGEILYPAAYAGSHIVDYEFGSKLDLLEKIENREAYMVTSESPFYARESLLYSQPIDFYKSENMLFLFCDVPSDALYTEARKSVRIVMFAGVAGLLLLAVSVFLITRKTVKPIKTITEKALKIADGHLDVEFDVVGDQGKTKNEVVLMRTALKQMLKEITLGHDLKMIVMEAGFEVEKAEAASEAKNRYFANVSHEIRTPMNAILGMSELLIEEDLNDKQFKYVADIKNASEALLSLINDILDLSKMDAGSLELHPVHFNFFAFIDHINSLSLFLCEQKNLRYEFEYAGQEPQRFLYADDTRLRQVLLNIIGNAIKFTKEGTVRVVAETLEECLVFHVHDTGIGIKEEALPELFSVFKRLDTDKNKSIQGTGLGLAIAKNLVEMMGGVITVDSVYGKGCSFYINVPKVIGDESLQEKIAETDGLFMAPDANVLIIDDNEINLNVAVGLLGLYRINCETSLSGAKAIEMVQKKDYDIVFMDHMMPEMDGIEATKRIRGLGGKYKLLPIVALTANAVSGMREKFISEGMSDFLSKPIIKGSLHKILSIWIPDNKKVEIDSLSEDTGGEYSELLKKAALIDGLDVELGLSRVAMQQDTYEKSLRLAEAKIPEFIIDVERLLDEGALYQFHIQMHGMKGVLANIGAMGLSEQALKLEKAYDDDLSDYSSLSEFTESLRLFGVELNRILQDTEKEKTAGNSGQLADELQKLELALLDYDYQNADETLKRLVESDYGNAVNENISKLKGLVDRFEYDAAVELINKGMKK